LTVNLDKDLSATDFTVCNFWSCLRSASRSSWEKLCDRKRLTCT